MCTPAFCRRLAAKNGAGSRRAPQFAEFREFSPSAAKFARNSPETGRAREKARGKKD